MQFKKGETNILVAMCSAVELDYRRSGRRYQLDLPNILPEKPMLPYRKNAVAADCHGTSYAFSASADEK